MPFHECPLPVEHIWDEFIIFITYPEVTSSISRLDIPSQKVTLSNTVSYDGSITGLKLLNQWRICLVRSKITKWSLTTIYFYRNILIFREQQLLETKTKFRKSKIKQLTRILNECRNMLERGLIIFISFCLQWPFYSWVQGDKGGWALREKHTFEFCVKSIFHSVLQNIV